MKIQHVGRYDRRRKDGSPSGDREEAFIKLWDKENNPPSWLNGGIGILEHLLHRETDASAMDHRRFNGDLTQEEATNAATVVQWLGTSCGWDFLRQCVEACGHDLVPRKEKERECQKQKS